MIPTIISIHDSRSIETILNEKLSSYTLSPDRMVRIAPEKTSITIGQVRWLKRLLSASGGKRMVVVFERFDTATIEAQNALLKVLEEYSKIHIMFLFTQNVHTALATIRSRCIIEKQRQPSDFPIDTEFIKSIPHDFTQPLSEHTHARPKNKQEVAEAFGAIVATLRPCLRQGSGQDAALCKNAIKILSLVYSNNLNPQLAMDHWMMSLLNGTV